MHQKNPWALVTCVQIGVNAKINYVYTWFLYEIENYWEYVCASLYPGVILVGTQVGMVSK